MPFTPSTNPSSVRHAAPGDLDALFDLERNAFAGDRLNRRQLRYLLTRAQAHTLVADAGGQPVGYIILLFNRARSHARVYSLAVKADFRGRGIGRALLAAGETVARERGHTTVRLEVRMDNEAAIALYRSAGYRPFATIAGYYADGEPALRLKKSLPPAPA